ncbi:hypothetical protein Emag_005632 [Eimeria magna]
MARREGVGSLLLKVLEPLPAAIPFWLAELQQLAWTAIFCYGDTRIASGGSLRVNPYLLALLVLDVALGKETGGPLGGPPSLHGCLICSFSGLRQKPQVGCLLVSFMPLPSLLRRRESFCIPPMAAHMLMSCCSRSGLYFASCCLFLTPVVFLAFAGCAYLQSESPRTVSKQQQGTRGLRVGSPPNSLLILADLTLLLTLDLLDLAAAFSTALCQRIGLTETQL